MFAEQNARLDKIEEKVNKLEKDVQSILNAIQTSQSTKERLVLGSEQGNGKETQHRPNPQTESRSTTPPLICG